MSLSTRPADPGPLMRDKRPYRCLSASLATEAASLSTRPANPGPRRLHGQSAGRADLDGVCVVGGQAFAGMAGGGNRTCCAAGRSRPPRFITAGAGQEYPLAAFARSGIRVSAAYSWSLEVARGETRRGARETPSALGQSGQSQPRRATMPDEASSAMKRFSAMKRRRAGLRPLRRVQPNGQGRAAGRTGCWAQPVPVAPTPEYLPFDQW